MKKGISLPGKGPGIFEVKGKNMALTVCEDIWHTKAIRQASRRGADLVLNLNASPFHRNKRLERKNTIGRTMLINFKFPLFMLIK